MRLGWFGLFASSELAVRRRQPPRAAESLTVVLLGGAIACSHATPPPAPASAALPAPAPARVTTAPDACPASLDLAELLERHALEYGTEAAVRQALPRRERGQIELGGAKSTFTCVTTPAGYRLSTTLAGLAVGAGIDAQGPWTLGPDGVVHRLLDNEAGVVRFDYWLATRRYLSAIDAGRDQARCTMQDGKAQAIVSVQLPELGNPELVFDLATAQLLAAGHSKVDGERTSTVFAGFTARTAGVRWPTGSSEHSDNAARFSLTDAETGVSCDATCLAAPPDTLTLAWPRSERFEVPMRFYQGELSLRTKVAGKDTWAILDSGASLSALDATRGLAAAFKPAMELVGSAATQQIKVGLGQISDVRVGSMALASLPVVHVPIPALDNFGDRRPDLILGYSLFAAAAVRVDYEKSKIVFAKSADGLHTPEAVALPIQYWEGKPMVEFEIDGQRGLVELDTGNAGSLTLFKRWASAHGLPRANEKTQEMRYLSGAGTEETSTLWFRPAKVQMGPIVLERPLADVADPPSAPNLAGILGNEAFARCSALVFDMRQRTLWLEPPCDRPVAEDHSGWQLKHEPDAAYPDRPWLVQKLVPEGTAARAGILPGDRVLSVNGKAARLDRESFEKQFEQAPGTVVKVEVARAGKKELIRATLVRVLE
jgi:hypothetical protein